MLDIVQTGQSGKSTLVINMHRLRKRVFKDRMKWDVTITPSGLEVDNFDLPNALYLLALNDDGQVIGNWRLLPTNGPTMIRDVWPDFMKSMPLPSDPFVWEASRFAVDILEDSPLDNMAQISQSTKELFCGLVELCMLCGIKKVYTMYDMRIARLLKKVGCQPHRISEQLLVDNQPSYVGCFDINANVLEYIRTVTGHRDLITQSMVDQLVLPMPQHKTPLSEQNFIIRENKNVDHSIIA